MNSMMPYTIFRRISSFVLSLGHGVLLVTGFVTLILTLMARFSDPSVEMDGVQEEVQHLSIIGDGVTELTEESMNFADVVMLPEVTEDPSQDLSVELARVRDWVSRRYYVSAVALEPVLMAAERAGRSEGIDPLLIVAVMAVESRFNPFAESHVGAQGLMQVIPRFHMEKISHAGGEDGDALFDPAINVHVGAKVLREGLLRYGNLKVALQYYGGAMKDPEARYSQKVLTLRTRLMEVAGRTSVLASAGVERDV